MALITLKAVGANGETPGCPVCTDSVWDLKSIEHPSRDECIQLLFYMISMNDIEICYSYFIPVVQQTGTCTRILMVRTCQPLVTLHSKRIVNALMYYDLECIHSITTHVGSVMSRRQTERKNLQVLVLFPGFLGTFFVSSCYWRYRPVGRWGFACQQQRQDNFNGIG